jgi:hypothetical protein
LTYKTLLFILLQHKKDVLPKGEDHEKDKQMSPDKSANRVIHQGRQVPEFCGGSSKHC